MIKTFLLWMMMNYYKVLDINLKMQIYKNSIHHINISMKDLRI